MKCVNVHDELLPLRCDGEQVPALEQDEARVRDLGVHLLGQGNGCDVVGTAVQDESRLFDLPQPSDISSPRPPITTNAGPEHRDS